MLQLHESHVITGDRDQVATALRLAYTEGRLVRLVEVLELPDNQVRVLADIHLPESRPRRIMVQRVRDLGPCVVGTAAVVAVLGYAGWLLVSIVLALVDLIGWFAAHWVQVVSLLALLLALAFVLSTAGSSHRCGGLHCGGCGR